MRCRVAKSCSFPVRYDRRSPTTARCDELDTHVFQAIDGLLLIPQRIRATHQTTIMGILKFIIHNDAFRDDPPEIYGWRVSALAFSVSPSFLDAVDDLADGGPTPGLLRRDVVRDGYRRHRWHIGAPDLSSVRPCPEGETIEDKK